jgi:pyruvate formate lyase activating enzyme
MEKSGVDRSTVRGSIFEVERFALNDGPGIRTLVFLKGCSLRCLWCSNPESHSPDAQLLYRRDKCIGCGHCIEECNHDALSETENAIAIDRRKCNLCGDCARVCYPEALVMVGREMTPSELLGEIERDAKFYGNSGGGVTFSGGEPLEQSDFLIETAGLCREHGIHTAVETCGAVSWRIMQQVLSVVDLFLYDIKMIDPGKHERCTGVSNRIILQNFRRLVDRGKETIVRFPVIPGYTDTDENVEALIEFLKKYAPGIPVHLLPYHRLGMSKYSRLNMQYRLRSVLPPDAERMRCIGDALEGAGFTVTIGG